MIKIKQTLLITTLIVFTLLALVSVISPIANAAECGGVKTSIIDCPDQPGGNKVEDTGIWGILLLVINILTTGVGVAAVGGIIYASIMYTTSAGSMEKVAQAKSILTNIVIGLVAYVSLWSFLNYITPGGLFAP